WSDSAIEPVTSMVKSGHSKSPSTAARPPWNMHGAIRPVTRVRRIDPDQARPRRFPHNPPDDQVALDPGHGENGRRALPYAHGWFHLRRCRTASWRGTSTIDRHANRTCPTTRTATAFQDQAPIH